MLYEQFLARNTKLQIRRLNVDLAGIRSQRKISNVVISNNINEMESLQSEILSEIRDPELKQQLMDFKKEVNSAQRNAYTKELLREDKRFKDSNDADDIIDCQIVEW